MERGDDRQVDRQADRQRERLLDAVLTIGSDLDLHTVLHTIIQTATESVAATYGALGVLDEAGARLVEFVTIGVSDDLHAAIGELPQGHGILGLLIAEPKPLRLPDLTRHPASYGFPPNHPPMRSFLGAPIAVRGQVFGNIYLCDKVGGGEFTEDDEVFVVNLASVASLAIENARLHARVAELATLEDRERIARDLHDTVIQRLFAVGLSLQATQRLVDDPIVSSRLRTAVDDLDTTVRDIRAAIFELQVAHRSGPSVRQQLLDLAAQSATALGFDPVIRFDGPIDAAVEPSLAEELLAVLREVLTNVARHAAGDTRRDRRRRPRSTVVAGGDRRRNRLRTRAGPRPGHRQPAHTGGPSRRGVHDRQPLHDHRSAGHRGALDRTDPLHRALRARKSPRSDGSEASAWS